MTNKNNTSSFDCSWDNKPVRWSLLGILLPVSGVMTTYVVTESMPRDSGLKVERVLEESPSVYVETGSLQSNYWAQETVQTGDSLASVLMRMGVAEAEIKQIMAKNSPERDMNQLRAGQSISIRVNASGQVTDVQFFIDKELERNLVILERVNGKWQTSTSEIDMKTIPTLRSIIVRTSARGAMAQVETPVGIRESLGEIFVDVLGLEDLKEGDTACLLYNSMYFRGQQMGTGDISAAEIMRGGKTYRAYYYSQGKGDEESGSYYDQSGKSLQQKEGFNAQPVIYTCIPSPYGYHVYPVLCTVHMHTGIDRAAPEGMPIKVAADGVVAFKGWKGGYGNTVTIQHANGVETLCGHTSAFSSSRGKASADEIIGYVGTAGRPIGPHLHYEARVNDQPVNPMIVASPTPKLTPTNMVAFRKQQQEANATLATVRGLPVSAA